MDGSATAHEPRGLVHAAVLRDLRGHPGPVRRGPGLRAAAQDWRISPAAGVERRRDPGGHVRDLRCARHPAGPRRDTAPTPLVYGPTMLVAIRCITGPKSSSQMLAK